jgi:hypothetical protein
VTDNRTTNRDDGLRSPAEAGDPDTETSTSDLPDEARVAEMKGSAVTVGPRGEIALDRSASGFSPEVDREPDPGDGENPSTAVNEEPSG